MPSTSLSRLLQASVLLIVLLSGSLAHARIWRDINGNEIEGEFVRKDGSMVTLLIDGEERTFPISTFSSLDKTYISRQKNPTTPANPSPTPMTPATPATTPETTPITPATPENTPPANPGPATPPRPPQANVPPAEFRIWRTVDGQRFRARYLSYNADVQEVTLELDTGRQEVYPLNDFSFADKEEVNRQVAAASRPAEPEVPVATNTPAPSNTFPETPATSPGETPEPQQTTRPRPPRNAASGESWARFVHRRKGGLPAVAEVLPAAPIPQNPVVPDQMTPATPAPAVATPAPAPIPTTGQPLMTQVTYGDSSGDSNPMTLVAIVLVIAAVGGFVWSRTRG